MAEPTFVYDVHDPTTRGLESTAAWRSFLAWMRGQRMNPNQTRRIELYDLDGTWFARTVEYTQARQGGRLLDPATRDWVTHTSTYVIAGPPPSEIPVGGARG
ncbi:hypothetical protein AB0O28_19020 [Microbispora sp. NPDC088329]|uniref:hypothetical protein n=1 Tax=Microbispora sp. NPDC088329 TaxID=3154869 RepID=UPI00341E5860